MSDHKLEIKNWHDVPVIVTTPDEEITLPAGAGIFVFTTKVAVRVTVAAPDSETTQGATP